MNDFAHTLAPKSDQLNADDLIAGPRTIKITKVKALPKNEQQPLWIYFEGDDGKPWKPCKTMGRVLAEVWKTTDGDKLVGRQVTIYRDPTVKMKGEVTGGIRISHMSHIEGDVTVPVTLSRGQRGPYLVHALAQKPPTAKIETKPTGNIEQALRMIAGTDKATIEHVLIKLREFAWTKDESRAIKEAADKVNAKTVAIDLEDVT